MGKVSAKISQLSLLLDVMAIRIAKKYFHPNEAKQILIAIKLNVTLLILAYAYLPISLTLEKDLFVLNGAIALGFSFSLLSFVYKSGKIIFSLVINILSFVVSLLIPTILGAEHFLFLCVFLPFLVFNSKEKLKKYLFVGLSLVLSVFFVVITYGFVNTPFTWPIVLNPVTSITVGMTAYILLGTILFFLAYYLALESDNYQRYYEATLKEYQGNVKLIEIEKARSMYASRLAEVGEMASTIAHEINNPLSLIAGHVGLLQKKRELNILTEQDMDSAFNKINQTVDKINQIIKSIKSFSRDGSKDPFQIVNLSALINDSVEYSYNKFKNKGIQLQTNCPSFIFISCRPVQIMQVLVNLLNNSYDALLEIASSNHWVQIGVTFNDEVVNVIVTDSGPGIPKELHEKIMEPYFTTKGLGKGTGLGLSICNNMVKSNGGSFQLNADFPNTQFVITLPRQKTNENKKTA